MKTLVAVHPVVGVDDALARVRTDASPADDVCGRRSVEQNLVDCAGGEAADGLRGDAGRLIRHRDVGRIWLN